LVKSVTKVKKDLAVVIRVEILLYKFDVLKSRFPINFLWRRNSLLLPFEKQVDSPANPRPSAEPSLLRSVFNKSHSNKNGGERYSYSISAIPHEPSPGVFLAGMLV
jgi:hypothetical protein